MIFNMVGGGGGTTLFAAIGVTYPAGSTLTCTNGSKTLQAKNTSGQWVFSIPKPNTLPETWTVTATNGSKTKNQSVSITKEGQFESVTLSYALILFDGADNTSLTGGWVSMNSGGTYAVSGGALVFTPDNASSVRFLRTVNPVDFSKYKTLYIDCLAPQAELPIRLYTRTDKPTDTSTYVASVHQPTTRGIVSIDLSAITTRNALYVGLGSKSLNGSSYYYNIYAEE